MGKSRDAVGSVLSGLRESLIRGEIAPGAVVSLTDTAGTYRTSVTPVREAFARLAGEGLLVGTRRLGYARPRFSAEDLVELYAFHGALVRAAVELFGAGRPAADLGRSEPDAEPLFAQLTLAAANRPLQRARTGVALALGPARRAESVIFDDLEAEAEALRTSLVEDRREALLDRLQVYHERRVTSARRLAEQQG